MENEELTEEFRRNTIMILDDYDIVTYDFDKISEPHFHVIDNDTKGKKFNCRIKIKVPEYLNSDDKLTNDQIDKLIEILNSSYDNINNWKFLILTWDHNNDIEVDNFDIPDYTKLKVH